MHGPLRPSGGPRRRRRRRRWAFILSVMLGLTVALGVLAYLGEMAGYLTR